MHVDKWHNFQYCTIIKDGQRGNCIFREDGLLRRIDGFVIQRWDELPELCRLAAYGTGGASRRGNEDGKE